VITGSMLHGCTQSASGAAIGAAAGGGPGAALGAAIGGQPGYSGESPLRPRRHRAPISATRSMDIPATAIRPTVIQAMDTPPTHSPAMDTQVTRVLPALRDHRPARSGEVRWSSGRRRPCDPQRWWSRERRCHPVFVISYILLGTSEWFVIHHTDCGMLLFTNDDMSNLLASGLKTATLDPKWLARFGRGAWVRRRCLHHWLTFSDNAKSVVEDVMRIRNHSLVPSDIPIYGYIYDVKSGKLVEVPEATTAGKAS
jgi:hypothetical protein